MQFSVTNYGYELTSWQVLQRCSRTVKAHKQNQLSQWSQTQIHLANHCENRLRLTVGRASVPLRRQIPDSHVTCAVRLQGTDISKCQRKWAERVYTLTPAQIANKSSSHVEKPETRITAKHIGWEIYSFQQQKNRNICTLTVSRSYHTAGGMVIRCTNRKNT